MNGPGPFASKNLPEFVMVRKLLENGVARRTIPPNFPLPRKIQLDIYPSDTMADLENRYEDNTKGSFYVDDQCIDCDLCRETAPDNFTRNDDGGYSYVYKQPESDDEKALCEEAMEGCPVEAIGNDGDD